MTLAFIFYFIFPFKWMITIINPRQKWGCDNMGVTARLMCINRPSFVKFIIYIFYYLAWLGWKYGLNAFIVLELWTSYCCFTLWTSVLYDPQSLKIVLVSILAVRSKSQLELNNGNPFENWNHANAAIPWLIIFQIKSIISNQNIIIYYDIYIYIFQPHSWQ